MVNSLKRLLIRLFPGTGHRANSARGTIKPLGFHADRYLIELTDFFLPKAEAFIETGCNMGTTARYVAKKFPHLRVYTCETDRATFEQARSNLADLPNAKVHHESSPQFLQHIHKEFPTLLAQLNFYWLDAHGYGFAWPLVEEVGFLTAALPAGLMFIDDFRVPGRPEFGFDQYDGQVCCFETIEAALDPRHEYRVIYPAYREKTSPWHPLRGTVLIQWGGEFIDLPPVLARHFTIARYSKK